MAGWTKAQYDEAYSFRVERYLKGALVGSIPGIHRPEVRINYHAYSMRPIMVARWQKILPILAPAITPADFVLIIGAGFGWGVRALRQQLGCAAIGTDISTYVQAEKGNDDSAEISAAITAVGLDPTTGRGLEVLIAVRTPGARAQELVLDEDLATQGSRNRVRNALGDNPTFICWEDIVDDDMTDQDILDMIAPILSAAAKKFFIYKPTANRSAQQLATLTGQRVVTTGDSELVIP